MSYKEELQEEYKKWENKKIKRKHRVIQVKNYTEEQIYNQIKDITEIATKEVEEYLIEYMNREQDKSETEESEEEEIEESKKEEESKSDWSEESESVDCAGRKENEEVSENENENEEMEKDGNEESAHNESANEPTNDELDDLSNDKEISGELDGFDDVSSGADYNSEELDDIYNYLEEGESADMMVESAAETLRKLGR